VKQRIVAAAIACFVFLGLGASAAVAHVVGDSHSAAQPKLAETGYDFTPMLVTAAVFLLIAGVAVLVAKYVLARSSHS
jgi:hypothetical protein